MILGPGQKVHLRLVSLEATSRPAELRRGWGEPRGSLSASLLNTQRGAGQAPAAAAAPGCPICSISPMELGLGYITAPPGAVVLFKGCLVVQLESTTAPRFFTITSWGLGEGDFFSQSSLSVWKQHNFSTE